MIIKKVICDNCGKECSSYFTFYLPDKVEYRCGSGTTIENGTKVAQVCDKCLSKFKLIDLRGVK